MFMMKDKDTTETECQSNISGETNLLIKNKINLLNEHIFDLQSGLVPCFTYCTGGYIQEICSPWIKMTLHNIQVLGKQDRLVVRFMQGHRQLFIYRLFGGFSKLAHCCDASTTEIHIFKMSVWYKYKCAGYSFEEKIKLYHAIISVFHNVPNASEIRKIYPKSKLLGLFKCNLRDTQKKQTCGNHLKIHTRETKTQLK